MPQNLGALSASRQRPFTIYGIPLGWASGATITGQSHYAIAITNAGPGLTLESTHNLKSSNSDTERRKNCG